MEFKVEERVKVGIFVFAGFIILMGTIMWVLGVNLQRKTYSYYIIFRNESVNGLVTGAFIKYQGVEIGKVKSINILQNEPNAVKVDVEINKNIKVYSDMVAQLNIIGITGLKYIEISGGSKDAEILPPGSEIKSKPSPFASVSDKMDDIILGGTKFLYNLIKLTNDTNLTNIKETLKNIKNITLTFNDQIPDIIRKLNMSIKNLEILLTELNSITIDIKQVSNKLSNKEFLDNIDSLTLNLNTVLKSLDSTLNVSTTFISNSNYIFNERRSEILALITSLEEVLRNLEILTRDLKHDPSLLLRGNKKLDRKELMK